jgi:hypothetical protein
VITKGNVTAPINLSPIVSNFSSLVQGRPYWVGVDGVIELTEPTIGFSQIIGVATSCNTFTVF